jgi:DNA-binding NarL/FixJ family response regulator
MIKVLLAEPHAVIRRHLRQVLEDSRKCDICGEAESGREAVELAIRLAPAVAVLDLDMPEMHGLEVARRLRVARPATEILILATSHTDELLSRALVAGARGYMKKSDIVFHLRDAVIALSRREPFLTPDVMPAWREYFLSERSALEFLGAHSAPKLD